MKNQQLFEEAYQIVIEKAKELYSTNQKMTYEQLMNYLNSKLPSDFQYDGLRSVFKAAWNRTDQCLKPLGTGLTMKVRRHWKIVSWIKMEIPY